MKHFQSKHKEISLFLMHNPSNIHHLFPHHFLKALLMKRALHGFLHNVTSLYTLQKVHIDSKVRDHCLV